MKLWRRVVWPIRRRLTKHPKKMRMVNGGTTIAIIGGDGAGKTTAVNELYNWLSKDFDTHKVHLGKPSWSWTTIAIRGFLKIGSSLGFYPFLRTPIQYNLDEESLIFPGYPWLFREICTARDRFLTYVKARRFATNGGLVICDRFPIPDIKLMDGPQIERMTSVLPKNLLVEALIKLEKKYYQQITLPELLFVLKVDPEITVQRKTDESPVSVRARTTEIWEKDEWQEPVQVVDASKKKEEVLGDLKKLIWSEL
jgi:thymidylate kinase